MAEAQLFTPFGAPIRLLMVMDIEWNIGDVIAKLRRGKRMNQTALAEKVGVNKATIVRAEDGDPKVSRDTYLKIASTLGTELVRLEMEASRLQGKGTQDPPSGATFPDTERRVTTDRRVAANDK